MRAAGVVLALNVVFLAACLAARLAPREHYVERIRQAFVEGDLVFEDFLWRDARRGWNQVSDCDRLQMLITKDSDLLLSTVAPLIYENADRTQSCAVLFETAEGGGEAAGRRSIRYGRYWHGSVPVAAALLGQFSLGETRGLLKYGVYLAALVLLLVAARAEAPLAAVGASVSATALLFWGIRYYDPSITHGPGDLALLAGIALLIALRARLASARSLILFSACFGAVVMFLEAWVGQLPTAAALLVPMSYLVARALSPAPAAVRTAVASLIAFGFGAAITLGVQQAITAVVAGGGQLAGFSRDLAFYTQPAGTPAERVAALGWLVAKLLWYTKVLANDSHLIAGALLLAATSAWLTAGWLAWKRRRRGALFDLLPFVLGTAVVAGWILVFQVHTARHLMSLVRTSIVPVSLGWGALLIQVLGSRAELRVPQRTGAVEELSPEAVVA